MPNRLYNKQVSAKGYKRGGGVDVKKAKEFRKNKKTPIRTFLKNTMEGKYMDKNRGTAEPRDVVGNRRVKKMGGGRIAGAARRAQEHGYYTPDMGMKGGRMYRDGGKVGKKKPRVKVIGIGKAKDYPGIKKIIEMNKKGKKRFKDGGSALKAVDKSKNPGLAKLPTQVRNKMGYMKKGGSVKKPKLGSTDYGVKKLKKGMMDKYQKREKFDKEVDLDKVLKSSKVRHARSEAQGMRKDRIKEGIKRRRKEGTGNFKTYKASTEAMGGNVFKDGGMARRRNTRRMNRLEELGRVDAERGFTRKGKRNLRAEKKRIVRELKK